ncbi:MAG TPA: 2-phospho-L-lactate guanylyltransferase [Solirubrobacteraceae bacterium]|nr:2-phospho-L-lactate guanylyltransferase [Solirubrobacteraceae bacterium]
MRTAAILPVKRFSAAKSRLGASVEDALRARLAQAMVADVLNALSQSRAIERTVVVTREPTLQQVTSDADGVTLVEDTVEDGQSAAVALGVQHALGEGFERVLCIPGDCPALDPAELDQLLGESAEPVVIVPDRHGTGTNGLLLTPPDAIHPAFGPGSCERHRALAQDAGLDCDLAYPSSLLLDIDTGADLAALRARLAETTGAAAQRTRAVLGQSLAPDAIELENAG